jgi:hypothetical protein
MIIKEIGRGSTIILIKCDQNDISDLEYHFQEYILTLNNLKFVIISDISSDYIIEQLDTWKRPPSLIIEMTDNSTAIFGSGPRALKILQKAGLGTNINFRSYDSQLAQWLLTKYDFSSYKIGKPNSQKLQEVYKIAHYLNGN